MAEESTPIKTVRVTRYVGPAPGGGSGSHFFEAPTGERFVVKFKENPQGWRVLVNELVAGQVGHFLGVPCPEVALIQIDQSLLDLSPEIRQRTPNASAGIHFGSQCVSGLYQGPPRSLIAQAANTDEFPRVIAFDALTQNGDRNNDGNFLIVTTAGGTAGYRFVAIDHGHCFGHTWDVNLPTRAGTWAPNYLPEMASSIKGAAPFKPVLDRAAELKDERIGEFVGVVPSIWGLPAAEADAMKVFLQKQRDALPTILEQNKSLFPHVTWDGGGANA